ncbi:MAG TPA: VWA domain-containing protein [Trebonia sp.]|nr:VWA domain-containing protein [Trebonia sp.]
MTSVAQASGLSPVERIHRFIDELRARGVPISMVERLDAMRAAQVAELDQADGLRTALRCTLVKSPDHLSVFEEVYELYFSPVRGRPAPGQAGPPLDLRQAVTAVLRDGSPGLARRVAEQAVGEFVQFEAGRPVAGVMYERATLAGLRLEELAAGLLAEPAAGSGGSGAPGQHLLPGLQQAEVARRAGYLKSQVRRVIRELLVADRGADAVAKTLRRPLTADLDISTASREELRDIQRAMIPIQHKLATTVMRKRRHHADLIDVRATLRASMATGAVPLRIVHRAPRPTKPQLYVLADMSGSVATFATFTVTLVSALSQLFSRLRSFAFIRDAAEVTDVFRNVRDPEQAMTAIRDFVTAGELGDYTDYGRALRQFHGAVGAELERRATVLIFGDARGNYLPAQEATLARIARRAGSVYWLNPEPPARWNTGDSVMGAYEPHCTAAVTCRTLSDLRRFIEQLG